MKEENREYAKVAFDIVEHASKKIGSRLPGSEGERKFHDYMCEKLEEIGSSFQGVDKCYAIQAGREIRVIVKPEIIDDAKALFLAKDIAKKIETELEYPGQIKVNVIREFRGVEYAK